MRNRFHRSDPYANAVDGDDASYGGGSSRFSSLIRRLASRPKDVLSLCLAMAATGAIVVNALFLQAGPHPAPIFADAAAHLAATGAIAARPAKTPPAAHDQLAELIEPSTRMLAVQRALAEFGYGQIKPTGRLGPETRAAIERFERERNLPVTGQMSERLAHEITAMKGSRL